MIFYLGLHQPNLTWNFLQDHCFISINVIRGRRAPLLINKWIMDSGAFTEISTHGEFRTSVKAYAKHINYWSNNNRLGSNLELAVSQDYMCEPFILKRTGLTVKRHQELTTVRYCQLFEEFTLTEIMPVLQGYEPNDYQAHIKMYGDMLKPGMRVGVGSVCKRNGDPKQIVEVLRAIKSVRNDLRLHGFGIKLTALRIKEIRDSLYSADSMAWSFAARRSGRDANGWEEAKAYLDRIYGVLEGTEDRIHNPLGDIKAADLLRVLNDDVC